VIAPLLLGIALGFFGSIPATGPLLFMVIDAGLTRSRSRALSLAVGGALAEAAYVALAFAGAARFFEWLPVSAGTLKLSSAVLVVAVGLWILRTKHGAPPTPTRRLSGTAFVTGFGIVALNPGFLAFWSAIAAFVFSTGLFTAGVTSTAALATGSCVGIVLWFSSVYALATRATSSISGRRLQALRRAVGVLLVLLGIAFGVSAIVAP
jgi:threonine/homoserine/homoserine lactone efflux protein